MWTIDNLNTKFYTSKDLDSKNGTSKVKMINSQTAFKRDITRIWKLCYQRYPNLKKWSNLYAFILNEHKNEIRTIGINRNGATKK